MSNNEGVSLSVEVQTTDGVAVISVREVVVDLSRTRFLDSSGIAVLLDGRREAADHDVEYRVESAHGIVREALTMTGV